jgi:mRNA interferase HigB
MLIVNYDKIDKFCRKRKTARGSFEKWRAKTAVAEWRTFEDVRITFSTADSVDQCVVFDTEHNEYRLIAKLYYGDGIVNIRKVLTHAQYDRDTWKADCKEA